MKNLSSLYYLLFIITASIIVSSCGLPNGNFPGSEYMPDMAHSIAYEATVNSYYYQRRVLYPFLVYMAELNLVA